MLVYIGMAILLYKKIWWPLAVWLVLTVATVYSGAPFHNPFGAAIEEFSEFFYNDPRRLTAVVTMLVTPMAAIALFAAVLLVVAGAKRVTGRFKQLPAPVWVAATAAPAGGGHRVQRAALLSIGTWCCSATSTTR